MAAADFGNMCCSNENNPSTSESEEDDGSDWMPSEAESVEETENAESRNGDEETAPPNLEPELTERDTSQMPTRGRTRVRHPEQWKKNKRKTQRNSGKEYESVAKKIVPAKQILDINCRCKLNCNTKVSFPQRKAMFERFYALGNWATQWGFLQGLVKQYDVKRRDPRDRSRRFNAEPAPNRAPRPKSTTRKYYVKVNGNDVNVCKAFFIGTFKVSNGSLNRAMQKIIEAGCPQNDQRGKHTPANKTPPPERVAFAKAFIEKVPVYESHYTRKHNVNRKYFAPGMTLVKLYSLYTEDCQKNNESALSDWKFRDIFNKEYSISFHTPLKDTCKTCDLLSVQIDVCVKSGDTAKESELKKTRELHHRKAEAAQKNYKLDVAKAADGSATVFCYDLQKTLPVPVLSTGLVYYKRQLWVYNLGIHDALTNNGFMYVWNESEGSRSPDEIASCIQKHLSCQPTASHVIAYADTCGSQNRNIKIAVFWLYIVGSSTSNVKLVDQKYFVSGHSWMDCDKDFGYVEKAKLRFPEIYLPDKWIDVIKDAKRNTPFVVTKMERKDFVAMARLEKAIVNRKTDTDGEKVEWMKIQWLQFRQDSPKKIYFKYVHSNDVEFRCIDVTRIGGAVAQRNIILGEINLQTLYPNGRLISVPKYNDLQDLLPFIPPINHAFYKNLKNGASAEDGELVDPEDEPGVHVT